MARNYNFIYDKLVEDQNDIVGHIAYSLYKSDKVAFIEDFKLKNPGRELSEADLEPFHSMTCLPDSINRYRLKATDILNNMLNNTLSASIQNIEEKCQSSHEAMLARIVEPLKTGFWYGVWQSVVAAFIFALILAAVGFITLYKTNDINISITTPQGQVPVPSTQDKQ